MNRRTFLEISSSLTAMPFMMGAGYNPHYDGKKLQNKDGKAVVFVMLTGGISHIDFTHANPDLPPERRSVNGEIETKTLGLHLGSDFKNLATITNKLNVVHSYRHKNPNHQNAVYWQMSGYMNNRTFQEAPAYGSYISKLFGPSNPLNGLPVYLRTSEIDGDKGGWIGNAYDPFEASDKGTQDLVMGLGQERFQHRLKILNMVDSKLNKYNNRSFDTMNKLRQQAVSMIAGNLKAVFDVTLEPENIQEAYGKNNAGKSLLLARRLIENGGKFISVNIGGWDMHQKISEGMKNRVPELDKALTSFILDIEARGLTKNVLLVVTGDFGRTPVINKDAGRDHWPSLVSLVMSGGNYEQGRIVGVAGRGMDEPQEKEFQPHDVAKTIFDHFGVQNVQLTDIENRPRWIYEKEAKNILV